jgi:hypothetical protein
MANDTQHIEHQTQGDEGGYDDHTQDHESKKGTH